MPEHCCCPSSPTACDSRRFGVRFKRLKLDIDVLKETEVKVGELSSDEVEIVSGVKAGDMIAVPVKGQVLKDGARIQVVE